MSRVERWLTRAHKGAALVAGRFRALPVRLSGQARMLLPLAAWRHFWRGEHVDLASMRFLAAALGPGRTLFDVGANVGEYSVGVPRLAGGGAVVAFEPVPSTLAVLQATLALNGARDVQIVPGALSDRDGELVLSAFPDGANNFWVKDAEAATFPTIAVRTERLDDWVKRSGRLPDAMKVDVEGHELAVLEGAVETLRERRPALLVECHGSAWDGLGVSRERLEDVLRASGYTSVRTPAGEPVDLRRLRTTVHALCS